jgi:hypothetical protein
MSRCSRADLQAQCAIKPWLSATHNNTARARVVIVDGWAHVGIGHSIRASALWLRLLLHEAVEHGTARSLRFASCVPEHARHAFSEPGHEVPVCGSSVTDPETSRNVSRTAFDVHEHLSFTGVEHLQASESDFQDSDLTRSISCVGNSCRVHPPETCAKLRHRLRAARPRVTYLYGVTLRDMALLCVRVSLASGASSYAGDAGLVKTCSPFSCLSHVTLRANPAPPVPACDVGLHLRSMHLDDYNCNLLSDDASGAPAKMAGSSQIASCDFQWRARRCKGESLHSIASDCPGEARFATSDHPPFYRSHTRRLGWSDLDEVASVTWNEGATIPYPAKLADVRATALAFVTLSRCRQAIVAPIVSHFSETAAIAAGVPVVGCCSLLARGTS